MPAEEPNTNESSESESESKAESIWGLWRRSDSKPTDEKPKTTEKSLKEILAESIAGPPKKDEPDEKEADSKSEPEPEVEPEPATAEKLADEADDLKSDAKEEIEDKIDDLKAKADDKIDDKREETTSLAPLPEPISKKEKPAEQKTPTEEKKQTDESHESPDNSMNDQPTDNISAQLSEDDKREIKKAIETIREKLNFVDIPEDERENLMRLGKTGRNFVEKALDLTNRSPGILPRSFDEDEFKRDAELFCELGEIADELKELSQQVSDNEAAVGSDAFTAALVVYQQGKLARQGDEMDGHLRGLKRRISDEIKDRLD